MPDSSELLPPASPSISSVVQRYLDGESIQVLAEECGRSPRTIYNWLLAECGPEYESLITQGLVAKIADADMELLNARDPVQIARAREIARFARMDFERRRPKLYGPKQEISGEMSWSITINRPGVTQPVVVEQPIIAVDSQVIDKTKEEQR